MSRGDPHAAGKTTGVVVRVDRVHVQGAPTPLGDRGTQRRGGERLRQSK
ncbi:MAG: hypothetical protein M3443_08245 [Actinomycetota bacterium]|nr:hypothetical protein [Actinomycetota bacterium]